MRDAAQAESDLRLWPHPGTWSCILAMCPSDRWAQPTLALHPTPWLKLGCGQAGQGSLLQSCDAAGLVPVSACSHGEKGIALASASWSKPAAPALMTKAPCALSQHLLWPCLLLLTALAHVCISVCTHGHMRVCHLPPTSSPPLSIQDFPEIIMVTLLMWGK